jgi:hypothetical protein
MLSIGMFAVAGHSEAGASPPIACDVKITRSFSVNGTSEKTLKITNKSDAVIDDVVIRISGAPMSYWGFAPDKLSIYPTGIAYLYLYQPEGGLLLPRQERDFTIFSRGPGGENFKMFADAPGMAEEFLDSGAVDIGFADYKTQIREAFRLSIRDPLIRKQMAERQGGSGMGGGALGVHMQSIISDLLVDIGMTLGDTLSLKDQTAAGDPRGKGWQLFLEAERILGDGDTGRVENLLRMSLILHPRNAMALNNLGYVIFLSNGDLRVAKEYVESALEIEPGNPNFLANLAEILWALGDIKGSERAARQSMGIDLGTPPRTDEESDPKTKL